MTTLTTNNTITPLMVDLDENIKNAFTSGNETYIDFVNPVTSSLDRVIAEHGSTPDSINRLLYVIGHNEEYEDMNVELHVSDLNELYDFILIDEE